MDTESQRSLGRERLIRAKRLEIRRPMLVLTLLRIQTLGRRPSGRWRISGFLVQQT
jgi:hypothetical protein